jgi:hypothetical protein
MSTIKKEMLYRLNGLAPQTRLVVDNQDTNDIISLIEKKHYETFSDYDRIAEYFDGPDVDNVCEGLYNFLKKEIAYREESPDFQFVSAPVTILRRGYSDCKGYSLFCGGVLDALVRQGAKINWRYRFVTYKPFTTIPGHVFIVVKVGQREIWLDGVMNSFDYHKPYWAGSDLVTELPAKVVNGLGAIGCGCDGKLGAGAVDYINAAAPALAVIPVAGPFLAVGAQLVGVFSSLFGSQFTGSSGVKYLTHLYQESVLGQNIDFKQVDPAQTEPAQQWFNAVFGVPVYDVYRYHTLSGTDPNTGKKLIPFPSDDTRARQYMKYQEAIAANVTYDQALAAAQIAAAMPLASAVTGNYGAWKNLPVAPAYAEMLNKQSGAGAQQSQTAPGTGNTWLWWLMGGVGAYFLLFNQKTKVI